MYDVLLLFWLFDADVVTGGGEDVKSMDKDIDGGADDDDEELPKKCHGARRVDCRLRNELLLLGWHCQGRWRLWTCGRGR